jgi:insulysin
MDFQILEISFPFEWQPPYWRHHPASFLSHFVGHEGPGSLHSYLKNKGWISALSAGQQNLARGFAMFKVTIHLTEAGFGEHLISLGSRLSTNLSSENYRSVISATFKYLSLLRSSKLESWRQTEQALITNTRFRFLEKGKPDQYAIWLTSHMGWPLPPERLISGPQQTEEWDTEGKAETDMRRMLDSLRASEGRAFLMAKPEKHEHIRGQQTWETEPIYGTQYRVERFDDALMKEAEAPNDILELYLPHKNEFIPANLDVLKKDVSEVITFPYFCLGNALKRQQPAKRPFLIRQTPLSSLWFKKDDQFWVPKAHAIMQIIR